MEEVEVEGMDDRLINGVGGQIIGSDPLSMPKRSRVKLRDGPNVVRNIIVVIKDFYLFHVISSP